MLNISQLNTSPMLVMPYLKFFMLGFRIVQTSNFQMSKLSLEKQEDQKIKLPTFTGSEIKQGNSRRSIYVSSNILKPLTMWIMTNCGELLDRWEYQTLLPVSWKTCYVSQEATVRTSGMGQLIGSRWRKGYNRVVFCHPVCLTYTLSTSWEMLGWMSYKLESR